ncbi:DUF6192 family protein [Streptomyces sp. 11x1]|uniref:DUF6192 family protein n=1 Tax=Streptomyces sp. 11x1 TaxID=3038642 RepID=UPI0037D9AC89
MEGQFPGERPEEGGAIHGLVTDGSVAAMVITDLLHRPYVTSKVTAETAPGTQAARPRSTCSAGTTSKPGSYAGRRRRRRSVGSTARHSWTWWRHVRRRPGQRAVQRHVVTDRRQPWRTPSRYPRSTCRSRPG